MTTDEELARDRDDYRQHAIAFWTQLHQGSEDAANAHTDAGDVIVQRQTSGGRAHDLLVPLLDDTADEVRYAAAADLLNLGEADRAVPVLEELTRDPDGFIAPTARLLLMKWRRQHHSA